MLTQTHPIDVLFTLPEGEIPRLQQAQQQPGALLAEAWDRGNRQRLATGRLLSLDNQIDTSTGTLKIKARFDNQDDRLFPNQFVNLRLQIARQQPALLVPAAAVQTGREGASSGSWMHSSAFTNVRFASESATAMRWWCYRGCNPASGWSPTVSIG
ncbi:Multidrug resistance protein mexA precursor [Edwardsiella tarda]|nr:Multidrug resistance protein mexA precursor [Edwardsiella tarda]